MSKILQIIPVPAGTYLASPTNIDGSTMPVACLALITDRGAHAVIPVFLWNGVLTVMDKHTNYEMHIGSNFGELPL